MKSIALIMLGILVGSGIFQFFLYFKIESLFIPIWSGIMILMFIADYLINYYPYKYKGRFK